ncbi:hypothetical protein ES288_D05G405000v1 [Gossypium darwinii]|uniref:Uncharacterized protein n=1 Tax=Gossypium darwinii TaxID=34276 RepID=A0A5D2CPQ1_GOSDA|nr:hypothetical protein ES288_D05G405000v1 [Gossypium darwinii]
MGCGFCEAALSNTVETLVVDCVVKRVGRQLDYVRRFHDNVEKLREKKRELADARDRLLHKIEDAKNRLLLIDNDVQNLQSRAAETLSDMGTLEEEIQLNKRCLNWCPNWSWRYQLSKKAMKKIQDISELLDKFGQLGPVGYPAPTALSTIDFLCSKEFVFSKSSETAFYQIIEALKDENINMIGLWGMGGVGKTTLAREVGSQAQKLNLFDKVVLTVVSQKPNFERIQDQIAQYIGFDMKNEQGRRSEQELWLRLKNEPRILIILDDIWESINLKEKIGIPIADDHKGCKVLLTTRRQQVCQAMDCRNVAQLGCLNDDEAWTLFEKKAGLDDFSDDSIKILANQIVQRFKDRRLTEIEDVNEENAYVCLEASFDYLKNMETKTCFLLCSLFPEDYEIYVENLVGYAWGLELYKGMDSIKDVRSEVLASIETLKNSGLLLDCRERHVNMRDVVRQFALWIASSRKEISFGTVGTLPMDESFKHYTAISFETDQTDELPKGVGFPYLKLLLLGGNRFMETLSEFFEGMKALQVCALNHLLISLSIFQLHMNLQTLYLINCKVSDISMLGKLKTLHILSLRRSDITELPTEAGDLENLRLLDLSYCYELRRITPNLIRRLSNLEELYLHGSSKLKWATENSSKRESYSSLSELNLLPKLVVISLDISSEHLLDGFVFRRLWSCDVCIGITREPIVKSVDACKQLFEDVESLELGDVEGHPNLIPSLDLGFRKLTSLDLRECHSMQCLIDASKQQVPITALSNLRKLSLNQLHTLKIESCSQLEDIIQDRQVAYKCLLQSLREVSLIDLPQLKGRDVNDIMLTQSSLQKLKVHNCPQLTHFIISTTIQELEQDQTSSQHHRLPLCFPNLRIDILECESLKSLFPIIVAQEIIQDSQVPTISFQCLREVQVTECNKLKFLFPMCVANSLGQLQTLRIESCFQLQEIIQRPDVLISMSQGLERLNEVELINLPQLKGRDRNDIVLTSPSLHVLRGMTEKKQISNVTVPERRGGTSTCTKYLTISNFEELFEYSGYNLSSLKILKLSELTELRVIWTGPIQVEHFQNLTQLTVDDCRRLRYIFSPTIARNLPQLSELYIWNCEELEQIIEKDQTSSQHHLKPICFPNLSSITIINCENLKCLFPITLAHDGLPNLLRLCLKWSNLNKEEEKVIRLPQLCSLELVELPNLVSFSTVGYHFVFQSLRYLKVKGCPNATTRFSVDSKQSVHAKTQVHYSPKLYIQRNVLLI